MKKGVRYKPLMMMRTRGISGVRLSKQANHTSTLSKATGTAIAVGVKTTEP